MTSTNWTDASRSKGRWQQQLGQPVFAWGHTFLQGQRAFIAGDTDRAEALATEALQIGTDSGQPDAALIYGTQLMGVRGQRGTMNELIPLIEQLASDAPEISPWMFGSLLAKAHVEVDRTDEALGQLEAFAASGFDLQLDHVWLSGMVDYADAAVVCGDPTYATAPLRAARPLARAAPGHRRVGSATGEPLPGWTGRRPRPLRRSGCLLLAVGSRERTVGSQVLRRPDGPVVGKRVGQAQSTG